MNKKSILLTISLLFVAFGALAQGRLDLRINEVLVGNENDLVDSDGARNAWIEIFNASHGSNAIEKMFITNDVKYKQVTKIEDVKAAKNDVAFHEIRRGDVATKVAPRSHVVFYADGDSARGTFHLPFMLKAGQENFIALYDVNGDLVDQVIVPANLPADHSFARISEENIDLHKKSRFFDAAEWQVCDGSADAKAITPGKFNARPINENIEKFHDHDGSGVIITLIAMGIVFSALALLFICFFLFGKAFTVSENKPKEEEDAATISADNHKAQPGSNDAAIAAICMALYQHLNAHDVESGILTFNHAHDMPNAWESKGNLLLQTPEHYEAL